MSDTDSTTLSVRLAAQVEQELASYCVSHKVTRSEAVKRALAAMLRSPEHAASAWQLGQRYRGSDPRGGDVARNTRRLLRERFR